MNYTIVNSSEIAQCRDHRLDPHHWIGGHHLEECDPVRREKVRLFTEQRRKKLAQDIADLRKAAQTEIDEYILEVRVGHDYHG